MRTLVAGTRSKGFTLLELMITVAVIAILAAVAYPSYSEYVAKSRRATTAGLLLQSQQWMERFYTEKGLYSGAQNLGSGNDQYLITHDLADHAFLLTATRREGSSMAGDACGNFSLAHTGVKAISQAAPDLTVQQCWGR